jgi:hypothetical protein
VKRGYLSQYFKGAAAKRLSAVEINAVKSNQHEINGDQQLRKLLGDCDASRTFQAKFVYLNDQDPDPVTDSGFMTWYDARQKARVQRGVNRRECRLYFPDTTVTTCGTEGDFLILARRQDDTLLAILTEGGSTIERQVKWLFGFEDSTHPGFSVKAEIESDQVKIEFAARFILQQIGVDIEDEDRSYLELLTEKFGDQFPSTRTFSTFARETLNDIEPTDDPDAVLLAWMDREEVLFRTLEKHLIAETLQKGFRNGDVDAFIRFSLSVQNRRKSRVGLALENHFEEILKARHIRYSRAVTTENRSKPDFLFPGATEYADPNFPTPRLSMLAVKSSCKDRWRQILAEAARVEHKHLLTLEPGISEFQTAEMRDQRVHLVLPRALHATFSASQQHQLMTVRGFMSEVYKKQ